jgi:chromosome segregation ATPase
MKWWRCRMAAFKRGGGKECHEIPREWRWLDERVAQFSEALFELATARRDERAFMLINDRLMEIDRKLEVVMANTQKMEQDLGRINASTTAQGEKVTRIVTSLDNVKEDLTKLKELVAAGNPDAAALQRIEDGLSAAADTLETGTTGLETVATTLESTASEWPVP